MTRLMNDQLVLPHSPPLAQEKDLIERLVDVVHHQGPDEAVAALEVETDAVIVETLGRAAPERSERSGVLRR